MENKSLYIQLYNIHGLFRGHDIELGRDADTGGQTKYVLEFAKALSKSPQVEKVEVVTRLIKDKRVSSDYSIPIEKVNDKFNIIRIQCGGTKYIRKELLWEHLEEFVRNSVKYLKSQNQLPNIIHSHYPDAGFVCNELSNFFDIPFIHTGHSLGKLKLQRLLDGGMTQEEIESKYKISHRINMEELILSNADLIIASSIQEKEEQYKMYEHYDENKIILIRPGIELEKFFSYNEPREWDDETLNIRMNIRDELLRFFMEINKPLILTICRPDKRKNIPGLIKAYGENKILKSKANLAIFAGIRKDIQTIPENEKEVLTEMLLLMDKFDLYGKMAVPKKHDVEYEVPELYRIAAESHGVFVNPSFTENFGLTLIEAAASGLPVVSTNHGGPKSIINNLKNGLLVEVTDETNIANAILKILEEPELWEQFSQNGIENVRKYYSWDVHTENYLNAVEEVIAKRKSKKDSLSNIGKKLLSVNKLIVVDIDDTLLGDKKSLMQLKEIIIKNNNQVAFGVATGRYFDSALKILNENDFLIPDVLITSVGTEIYYHTENNFLKSSGWKTHISYLWEREKIIDLLKEFDFLIYQEEEVQSEFKISYHVNVDDEHINRIREKLKYNKMKCNFIYSHSKYIDILPYRASKGRAVNYLSYRWNIPQNSILTSGNSGNDEDLLHRRFLGVVVGNYSKELGKLKKRKNVYFAKEPFAAGIIEGINHYKFL
ncbi:MAG: HAD-IIB family hydrolase [Ignavibacterium sp.]